MHREKNIIKIALADDHVLIRNAIATMIDSFEKCKVIHQSSNGKELTNAIIQGVVPDIILLDLNMKEMDGFETAKWLQKNFPEINVLILSQYDSELALIRLLQRGVKGIVKKDVHPSELKTAIYSVMQSGFYYSNHITGKIANLFRKNDEGNFQVKNLMLSEQELAFLKLACSELTYKEIAVKMGLRIRSIDTLRETLFIKLDVKSRVGLAILTIRNGMGGF